MCSLGFVDDVGNSVLGRLFYF